MPQMFPINWTTLFITFCILLITTFIIMSFIFIQPTPTSTKPHLYLNTKWTW